MQDLLRIVLVVLILLFLIKKKVDLGSVLFLGAILSGLLFGLNVKKLGLDLFKALISFETLSLIGIIILVLYLGNFLQARGNFRILVDSLKDLVPEARLILAIPPVFIGLLPMLGGALMSAPIVKEAGVKLVELKGIQVLDEAAKKHFKLTPRILSVVRDKK